MAKKKRRRLNRKTITKLGTIVCMVLAIYFLAGFGLQLRDVYQLNQQAKLVEEELESLQDENASLLTTRNKLEDPAYVTTYARGEYMFSKSEEKVFYLPSLKDEDK